MKKFPNTHYLPVRDQLIAVQEVIILPFCAYFLFGLGLSKELIIINYIPTNYYCIGLRAFITFKRGLSKYLYKDFSQYDYRKMFSLLDAKVLSQTRN